VRFSRILETFLAGERNRPTVAITFDDGYADSYEHAFPLLQKHEMPCTFFLTVGLLERAPKAVERFRLLRRSSYEDIRPLTWSQVLEMRRCGMEIGAHTFSHPNLARLDRKDVEVELKRSKEIIEQHLGEGVTLMAYPFGKPGRHFHSETAQIAAESGYEYGASVLCKRVEPGCPRLSVPRFIVSRDSLETLSDKVHGAWDLVGVWQEKAPLWMAKIVSPRDFSV
jgi:peptidoglycan/xylan/chitin deacetylase (PgdA/CDA1 family)